MCSALVRRNASQPEIVRLFAVLEAESLAPSHPAHAYFALRQVQKGGGSGAMVGWGVACAAAGYAIRWEAGRIDPPKTDRRESTMLRKLKRRCPSPAMIVALVVFSGAAWIYRAKLLS